MSGRTISSLNGSDDFVPYISGTLSFPYPTVAAEAREVGQGCTSCVHRTYCPALYWFMRYDQPEPDDHNGIQCASWSDNPADQVKTWTDYDIQENEYRWNQNYLEEAHQELVYPVTASYLQP